MADRPSPASASHSPAAPSTDLLVAASRERTAILSGFLAGVCVFFAPMAVLAVGLLAAYVAYLPSHGSPSPSAPAFGAGRPCFMPIERLAPELAHQLSLRRILGVRNSTHTLVKIVQPFAGPALRLVSYTHPEYLEMLGAYFTTAAPAQRGDAFLMRGTEGETVANARRGNQIDWFHDHQRTVLVQKQEPVDELPPLPLQSDAPTTAKWIREALEGRQPVPEPITEQVEHCLHIAKNIQLQHKQVFHDQSQSR